MWIDSQNRKSYVNSKYLKRISILDSATGEYGIFADDICVGSYSTEERALEVLNEIKDMVEDPDNYIYEMQLK